MKRQPQKEILEQAIKIYLYWRNNYLTVDKYAEHYNMNVETATAMIELGRQSFKLKDESYNILTEK